MTSLYSDGNWGKGEGSETCITGARGTEQREAHRGDPFPGEEQRLTPASPAHGRREDSCETTDMKTRSQAPGPLGARTNPEKTSPTAVPQHKLHKQVNLQS